MNGKRIPNKDLSKLPKGTKLLIHCTDEDFWLVCTVENDDDFHYLKTDTNSNFDYLDDVDGLNKYMEAYEYNQQDADKYIEFKEKNEGKNIEIKDKYAFDIENLAIIDTYNNKIVCICESKNLKSLKSGIKVLLSFANKGFKD